eukprot:CAMPEP_0184864100 /NCGR_PEP_ID=MMETSP0580-20130426/13750_1 /TAXON_ID=1118495 /ORGANISM="Dactyliosolen fragilissimus" /LENGTH=739 /DNA_ID=CAMNT_0027362747 /DNA_START=281 /DNA_END=2500 /DNA_ORIENTATION=+
MPPVSLIPPRIDSESLLKLTKHVSKDNTVKNKDDKYDFMKYLLPANTIVDENKLIIPVQCTHDIKNLVRLVYRLNQGNGSEEILPKEVTKTRIDLAFETFKSLNQLSELLEERKSKREMNFVRDNVEFRVGDIVQHKEERWRAVVSGWKKVEYKSSISQNKKTSLTTKKYSMETDIKMLQVKEKDDKTEKDELNLKPSYKYDLILDTGDLHLLGGKRLAELGMTFPSALEREIEMVSDMSLKRIRSPWIALKFVGFDPKLGKFIPNDVLSYEYPIDVPIRESDNTFLHDELKMKEVSMKLISETRSIASKLRQSIINVVSSSKHKDMQVLHFLEKKLEAIACGKVENTSDKLELGSMLSEGRNVMSYLNALLNFMLEISDMTWQRRRSSRSSHKIKFPLGAIVKHKKYGFRGIIVGWDPTPTVDVSKWDGLQDVRGDVNEMPFYHIKPDQGDMVQAFGGQRSFRYVCEENLEVCPFEETSIDIDIDEANWTSDYVKEGTNTSIVKYVPSDILKYKYAEKFNGEEETVACIQKCQDSLSRTQEHIMGKCDSDSDATGKTISTNINMDDLFFMLQHVDNSQDGTVIEEIIKEIWKCHPNMEIRFKLEEGMAALLGGFKDRALTIFNEIVHEDPTYVEAWNKKATCHYMLGDMIESEESAKMALSIEQRHFQALSGLGLLYSEESKYEKAASSFQKSLELNPWSPGSSRLSACLDSIKRIELKGVESDLKDEGSREGSAPHE